MVGRLELEAGNLDAAVDHLEKCRKRDPGFAPSYLALAAARSKQGDYPAVAKHLDHYLTLNPDHQIAHLYYAECLLAMNETERAKGQYVAFIDWAASHEEEQRSRLIHSHERLAEIADKAGDGYQQKLHAGIAAMLEGLEQQSAEDGEYRARDKLAQAVDLLQAAKREKPLDPEARAPLARVLSALGDEEAAERLAAKPPAETPAIK